MTEWPEARLGDLCERITVGFVGKMSDQYVDEGIPFLRSQNIQPFRIEQDGVLFIGEEFHKRIKKSTLRTGDVAVVRTGYPGTAAVVPPGLNGSNCADLVLITPSSALNPHFLAAVFNSTWGKAHVGGQLVGSAQQHFNVGSAKDMMLRLPDRNGQDRIADVLCGLNDLIENIRRRIEVLEEMTQAIYREWFVEFRYPGHEDSTFVDSSLGPIPNDWKVSTCGDSLTVLGGGTPSKKEPSYWNNAEVPWYTPSDLTKTRSRFAAPPALCINELGLSKSSAKLFPAGSVMMTSRATLGVLAIAQTDATTNQGFIVIPPDDRWPPSFIFEWLDHNAEQLESVATGATFKEITKGAFKEIPFLVPTAETLSAFRSAVEPIDGQVNALLGKSRVLADLRDLLLPKLVSGEINVSALDLVEAAP